MANKTKRLINSNEKTLWFLFIVWPLSSFFYAIKNFHIKRYRKFILLFGVLYGFNFIPIPNSDGSRYAQHFEEIGNYTLEEYFNDITHIYTVEARYPDVYTYTLFFFLSKFSDSYHFFFLIVALIYFFVFLKLISSLFDLVGVAWGRYYLWFFLGCVFIFNFSIGINGVRHGLAFMVFSLGAFKMILTNDNKYLGIALLSPLIHFSFLYPILFLIIYQFFPFSKNKYLLVALFLFALFAGTIFQEFIQNNIGFFGEAYEAKFQGYTGEAYIERREAHVQRWNWYVAFRHYTTYYFSVAGLLLLWLWQNKLKQDSLSKKLFGFALLMLIASFISGGLVDSISNRFNAIAIFFTLATLFYLSHLNKNSVHLKILSRIYIPVFIIHALVIFRGDFYTVSPYLIFGNPILMFFLKSNISIQELILG